MNTYNGLTADSRRFFRPADLAGPKRLSCGAVRITAGPFFCSGPVSQSQSDANLSAVRSTADKFFGYPVAPGQRQSASVCGSNELLLKSNRRLIFDFYLSPHF
jgi:hypothetical protein